MRRTLLVAVLAAAPMLAQEHGAAPAHDGPEHAKAAVEHGKGHEEAPMPNEIWWKWANFVLLIAGLGYLIGKNAGPFFRARTEEIQRGIREASAVRAEAEQRAAEIERRIGNLASEVQSLKEKSHEEIAREGERVRAETAQQIAKIQKQAEAEIASAAKHATQDLKAYAASLAVNIAAQDLQSRMRAEDQEQLANEFIHEIRGKATLN